MKINYDQYQILRGCKIQLGASDDIPFTVAAVISSKQKWNQFNCHSLLVIETSHSRSHALLISSQAKYFINLFLDLIITLIDNWIISLATNNYFFSFPFLCHRFFFHSCDIHTLLFISYTSEQGFTFQYLGHLLIFFWPCFFLLC